MPSVIDTVVVQPIKNGLAAVSNGKQAPRPSAKPLLERFLSAYTELQSYKNGQDVVLDGHHLSIPAVAAVARFGAKVSLTTQEDVKSHIGYSRDAIDVVHRAGTSIYGVSTGFGGSADTRTDNGEALGLALIQHQHIGVMPTTEKPLSALPLLDPLTSTSMPESWVRGAVVIRMNSLLRGHSGVRWDVIKTMGALLDNNITPMVPLRGSISASGDLSPLSYVAGSISANPYLKVFTGPAAFGARKTTTAPAALKEHGITPVSLQAKEHLGIMNGTAFSASVAALALNDAVHLALLAQVCTAMGTEALIGTRGSFDPFLHNTCRPHPGQIEAAANIWDLLERSKLAETEHEDVHLDEDKYVLRQDRYSLRTAAQFLGPQIEDFLKALDSITIECNSTTDNPLVDWSTGKIHHGGNFQAMHVTNAMEQTRVALHHIGKLLFSQSTELLNPVTNRGLPPSLAATEPSLDFHTKGVDIATAAYVSELGWLANPVSTHIQSAEMHNQSVNSLALISGRATIQSLDVLTTLIASYLYILAQALDLRAMQADFRSSFKKIVKEELASAFGEALTAQALTAMSARVFRVMNDELDHTTTMDVADRMEKVAASSTTVIVDFLSGPENAYHRHANVPFVNIPSFRTNIVVRSVELQKVLRHEYLTGVRDALPYLNKTRPVYEYIRKTLGVRMYGFENNTVFANGLGGDDPSIGQYISTIQESIRDGNLQAVVASLFQ